MPLGGLSKASTYDLMLDFQKPSRTSEIVDRSLIRVSPHWGIVVVRMGRPLSYSRATQSSIGSIAEGAFTRKEDPFIITDDCISLTINGSKRQHVKTLSAVLKQAYTNYLNPDILLPGDWALAWMVNNPEDHEQVQQAIKKGQPMNTSSLGLKFVGRVHSNQKTMAINPINGTKEVTYALQCVGFDELDTQFFYDLALATSAVGGAFRTFMAQIGLDFSKWSNQQQIRAGKIKDNSDQLISILIDMILGKGVDPDVNLPSERASAAASLPLSPLAPQANKEAPYAYLVPKQVGSLLGISQASKGSGIFGYADILKTVIGVQAYDPSADNDSYGSFVPQLDEADVRTTESRKYTPEKLKGAFLPVNPSFVNRPLWQILQQYLNPAINEMYTALKVDATGAINPTLIARQIPFSTESIQPSQSFQLTKFLSLPRWKVDPTMVTTYTIGQSNATRTNLLHVYGEAEGYASNKSVTNQLVRNPPIYDQVDIQRSGIRGHMMTVNCAIEDQLQAPRDWMEAIADWSFGSQFTLNGSMETIGIQSPIAEGDNIEFDGVAYHIESIVHRAAISGGVKTFRTHLELSNGMPIDQSSATQDFPRYPGFRINATQAQPSTDPQRTIAANDSVDGDETFAQGVDPGVKVD